MTFEVNDTQIQSEVEWISTQMDPTGQYITACERNGYVYTSNNYGSTWLQQTNLGTKDWYGLTRNNQSNNQVLFTEYGGYLYKGLFNS